MRAAPSVLSGGAFFLKEGIEHFTLYIKKFRFTIYAIQQNIPAEHPVSICIQQRFLQDLIVLIFQIVECRTVVCAFTCDVF